MGFTLIPRALVFEAHRRTLAEHGGAQGIRNEGLIDSALSKPANLIAYGSPARHDLAASYAFGLARNHGFVDGNKRVAAVVSSAFVLLNGTRLDVTQREFERIFVAVAAGEMTEQDLAAWFERNCVSEDAGRPRT